MKTRPLGLERFCLTPVARTTRANGAFALIFNNTGADNTAVGDRALENNTASGNTAVGSQALLNNTTGSGNTANGALALFFNTTGINNTATGADALQNNTIGTTDTANGAGALDSNTTGSGNTANGAAALLFNTIGNGNTADGFQALQSNTSGNGNTANGLSALFSNTTGNNNTANGLGALFSNTTGNFNTANGINALFFNTTGIENTAIGDSALFNNTTGTFNTAIGESALVLNTGSFNIALGNSAGMLLTTGDNNIDIGSAGVQAEANTIRIGNAQTATFIAGIRGVTTGVMDAIPVLIDSAGQLGTASSSHRFKEEIKPMDKASEAILGLKPVTFHYKGGKTNTPQFGLIAEEVAAVNPDLVVRDKDGEIYTVRYDAVNAMLLNEFLKEHRTVQEQQKEIDTLKSELKEQKALIQKVSAQLEASKPAPQVVNNP
jgi:hypothetical protein